MFVLRVTLMHLIAERWLLLQVAGEVVQRGETLGLRRAGETIVGVSLGTSLLPHVIALQGRVGENVVNGLVSAEGAVIVESWWSTWRERPGLRRLRRLLIGEAIQQRSDVIRIAAAWTLIGALKVIERGSRLHELLQKLAVTIW